MRSRMVAAVAAVLWLGSVRAAVATEPAAALPAPTALAPLTRVGEVERRTPETLWERINGEAEVYRAYGYSSSAHALYESPADPDRRVDLSLFRFADPLGAFGIFAAFRPPECAPLQPFGNGGCLLDYQAFFWQGDTFVLADAAGRADTRAGDLRRALEAVAAALGPTPPRPEPVRAFSRFVDTRTIRYQPQHLLGREALPPGLEGLAGTTPVFVSTGACDIERIERALDAYAQVLQRAVRTEVDGYRMLSGVDPVLGPVTLAGS